MKKSIIFLAMLTSTLASAVAVADSNFYGFAQVEIASWSGDFNGTSVDDAQRGRLGFKSSTDLGEGMKALARFEFEVDTADGDAVGSADGNEQDVVALSRREMLVGLRYSFGQLELGRLRSAYKYTGGLEYDPYESTILEARGNGGMTGGFLGHEDFISDSVAFQQKLGIFAYRITYDFDDGGPTPDGTSATGDNVLSASFKFSDREWEVFMAYIDEGADIRSAGSSYSSTKYGGLYNFGDAGKLSLQIEAAETETTGATADTDVRYLDYQLEFSKNDVMDLAYGLTDRGTGGVTDEDTFLRLAYTHKLGRKTKTWVGYRSTKNDLNGASTKKSVIVVGLQTRF